MCVVDDGTMFPALVTRHVFLLLVLIGLELFSALAIGSMITYIEIQNA